MLIVILLHWRQTVTCLVDEEKNKVKEPEKNIVDRGLKTIENKKVL